MADSAGKKRKMMVYISPNMWSIVEFARNEYVTNPSLPKASVKLKKLGAIGFANFNFSKDSKGKPFSISYTAWNWKGYIKRNPIGHFTESRKRWKAYLKQ